MIDQARALLLAIDQRRDAMEREENTLEKMSMALEHYVVAVAGQEAMTAIVDEIAAQRGTEQPGPVVDGEDLAADPHRPAPASQPEPTSVQGVEAARPGTAGPSPGPRAASAPVSKPPAGETAGGGRKRPASTTPPAASPSHQCPDCDAPPFAKSQGLGRHRAWKHPERFTPARQASSNGKADHPARAEKFLCGRNCGASFLSREGRKAHEDEATCQPKQTRPSLSDRAKGLVAGMGE